MRIEWSQTADRQFLMLLAAIYLENPQAARRLHQRTIQWTRKLRAFPNAGRKGRFGGTRELFVVGTPFLIIYTVQTERVLIDFVLHTSQKWPPDDGEADPADAFP